MRCRTKSLVASLCLTLSVPFLLIYWIQLQSEARLKLSRVETDSSPYHDGPGGRRKLEEMNDVKHPSLTTPTTPTREATSTEAPSPSKNPSSDVVTTDIPLPSEESANETSPSPAQLRELVEFINVKEVILNADKFDSLQDEDVVFIVQVHRRLHYLQYLIDSLRVAAGIDRVLVVFSHDYMDGEINKLIQSIDFCQVVQIFFPYAIQLHPNSFPGDSPDDCSKDITRDQAVRTGCANAAHPDQYGHYRQASVTAIKHHWWWKINKVFDGLKVTRNFNGSVFFLEEDHYLSPDGVHVAKELARLQKEVCKDCDFVSLGMYSGNGAFSSYHNLAYKTLWFSSKHNMGFGMNRATWNRVKNCAREFCTFDDYNWDWSLCALSKRCLQPPLQVLVSGAPRVYHIGTCGTHQKKSCDIDKDLKRVQGTLQGNSRFLHPSKMEFTDRRPSAEVKFSRIQTLKGYGGWGDPRDHDLCMSLVLHNGIAG